MGQATDRDYERLWVDNRQISVTHFLAVNWAEGSESPVRFAYGYWSADGVYHQGFVGYGRDGFTESRTESRVVADAIGARADAAWDVLTDGVA